MGDSVQTDSWRRPTYPVIPSSFRQRAFATSRCEGSRVPEQGSVRSLVARKLAFLGMTEKSVRCFGGGDGEETHRALWAGNVSCASPAFRDIDIYL